jgi:ribosomal protein S12 methylthiotransferase accessory factor
MTAPANHNRDMYVLGCNGSLRDNVLPRLSQRGFNVIEVADAPTVADVAVLFMYPFQLEAEREFQRAAREGQYTLIRVLVDVDSAMVGPVIAPETLACFECLNRWTRTRWSMQLTKSGEPLTLPWPPMVFEVLANLICKGLDEAATDISKHATVKRYDWPSNSCTPHAFSVHPDCAVCGQKPFDSEALAEVRLQPRIKHDPRIYRAVRSDLTPERLKQKLVDPFCGLVREMRQSFASAIMPFSVAEVANDDDPQTGELGVGRTGSADESARVAILEALERFCGFRPRGKRTSVRGSYNQLRSWAVDPRAYILHEPSALDGGGLTPYDDDTEFNWVWGFSLRSQRPALVPEQLAYFRLPQSEDKRFVRDSSSGCALGNSLEEAMLYGLFELIERDAYLTSWYGHFAPVELDVSNAVNPDIHALIARAEGLGFEVHLFDIGVGFKVAAIAAVVIDRTPSAPIFCYSASGAHFDPEKAALGALIEGVTTIIEQGRGNPNAVRNREVNHALAHRMFADASLVTGQREHILLHAIPESFERLKFLFTGKKSDMRKHFSRWYTAEPKENLTEEFSDLVSQVLTVARDLIIVDQGFPLLESLNLSAVKVLAPGLLPISFGHKFRRVSTDRLNQASRMMGSGKFYRACDINPFPHNFP